jgi:hypothetical protein
MHSYKLRVISPDDKHPTIYARWHISDFATVRDMDDHRIKAQYYRDQATNTRTLAVNEDNLEVRGALIAIAETYETLWLKVMDLAKQRHNQALLKDKL